jgi:hypothetical protein
MSDACDARLNVCLDSKGSDILPQRAAKANEPPEMNFIRKHSSIMKDKGLTNPAARLFSNPAGESCRLCLLWLTSAGTPAMGSI